MAAWLHGTRADPLIPAGPAGFSFAKPIAWPQDEIEPVKHAALPTWVLWARSLGNNLHILWFATSMLANGWSLSQRAFPHQLPVGGMADHDSLTGLYKPSSLNPENLTRLALRIMARTGEDPGACWTVESISQ